MKKLYVFDLDKTLLPYDSFRRFVFFCMKSYPIFISSITVLRLLRIISDSTFKREIINKIEKSDQSERLSEKFSSLVLSDINLELLGKSKSESDPNKLIILISASPDIYVKKIAEKLSIIGQGSCESNKEFKHMYGPEKVNFIEANFPKKEYSYSYAVSDSISDMPLLSIFEEYDLVYYKKNKLYNKNK